MRLGISLLSAPPTTSPSLPAVLFSVCCQLRFGQAGENDSIVLFGCFVTGETSTGNL